MSTVLKTERVWHSKTDQEQKSALTFIQTHQGSDQKQKAKKERKSGCTPGRGGVGEIHILEETPKQIKYISSQYQTGLLSRGQKDDSSNPKTSWLAKMSLFLLSTSLLICHLTSLTFSLAEPSPPTYFSALCIDAFTTIFPKRKRKSSRDHKVLWRNTLSPPNLIHHRPWGGHV